MVPPKRMSKATAIPIDFGIPRRGFGYWELHLLGEAYGSIDDDTSFVFVLSNHR
jgi:hypothetical protein